VSERERVKKEETTVDDCDTHGSTGNLAANRLGRAGLKKGAKVAVEEDHRGGTVPQESDVTDTALGRKRNGDALLGYSRRIALRREQCDVYC
jgi:hypothetical protein